MNNVIQFRGRKPVRAWQLFDRTFFTGVAATLVLPQLVFCSYFGVIAFVALAAAAVTGIGIGFKFYDDGPPPPMPPCVPATVARSWSAEIKLPRAA